MNDPSKLPKWAQATITEQEQTIESLKTQVEAFKGESKFETITAFVEPVWQGAKVPVAGDYQGRVTFLLGGQDMEGYRRQGEHIQARVKDGRLYLYTNGRMVIRPTGGVNTVEIAVEA